MGTRTESHRLINLNGGIGKTTVAFSSVNHLFCENCQEDRSYNIVPKTGIYRVQGHNVEATFDVAQCSVCGAELDHEELFDRAMQVIQENFAKQVGLDADKMRGIRDQYKLGIRPFSKLIGLGTATVSRLESRGLPNNKQAQIYLDLDQNPHRIFAYFDANKGTLSPRELKSTELLLDSWKKSNEAEAIDEMEEFYQTPIQSEQVIESIYQPNNYSEFNGYKKFELNKFVQMVLFFSRNGVNITKLMKLMWYSDFVHYKKQTVSISGATYARLQYGPVPQDHELVLSHLQRMGQIVIEEQINDEGWILKTVKSTHSFRIEKFSEIEFAVIREIEEKFAGFGSRKISDYSHLEKGWIETPPNHLIDYAYAIDLNDF